MTYNYKINNCTVTQMTSIRYLEIVLACNMSFSLYINIFIKRLLRRCKLCYESTSTSNFKNNKALNTIFFFLIESHLEFGSMLRAPSNSSYTD